MTSERSTIQYPLSRAHARKPGGCAENPPKLLRRERGVEARGETPTLQFIFEIIKPDNDSGYALYLVLIVLTVAAILFTITLTSIRNTNLQSIRSLQRTQADLLAQSGIARLEYFLNGGDGHDITWQSARYEERIGSYGAILLSCARWGAYNRFSSIGTRLKVSRTMAGLVGRDIPGVLRPALTLSGHIGGLVLAEGSAIDGQVVLHHGAVKRNNNRTVERGSGKWTVHRSSASLPFDKRPLDDFIVKCRTLLANASGDTLAVPSSITLTRDNDSLIGRSPLVVLGSCTVGRIDGAGATVVVDGTVLVNNSTACMGICFVAQRVIVEGGQTRGCVFFCDKPIVIAAGTHASQFFSTDSITVAEDARCASPAVLACRRVVRPDSSLSGCIIIAGDCRVSAHAICYADSTELFRGMRAGPGIVVNQGAEINGFLITDSDIDIQAATVNGGMYARSISTMHNNLPSKNWLYACALREPGGTMMFPLLGEIPMRVEMNRER
ncbi:MAG: hypothetical protein GF418_01275 [Chitinivibrionales bacterium]|nr:hypothetical protein [Chitinivibrionales bacterium]MBD3394233.1 hypothetical protein [Chitinivibrionales bacterium]